MGSCFGAADGFSNEQFSVDILPLSSWIERSGISKNDLKKFYKVFEELKEEENHCRTIKIAAFLESTEIEFSQYAQRALQARKNSGESLTFSAWVLGCWNYCTMDEIYLTEFAFSRYADDTDKIKNIMLSDVVRQILGKEDIPKSLRETLDKFMDGKEEIDFDTWLLINEETPLLMAPCLDMQAKIKARVMSPKWWIKALEQRRGIGMDEDVFAFLQSQ